MWLKGGKNEGKRVNYPEKGTLSVKTSWRRWCKRSVLKDEWDVATWGDGRRNPRLERGKMEETSKRSLRLEEVRDEERRWNEEEGRGDHGVWWAWYHSRSLDSTLERRRSHWKVWSRSGSQMICNSKSLYLKKVEEEISEGSKRTALEVMHLNFPMADHPNHLRF